MNYKLINKATGQETICDKVVVDGWDYYVSDEIIEEGWKGTAYKKDVKGQIFKHFHTTNEWYKDAKKVIATTNPSIDIPKVVDEIFKLSFDYFASRDKIDVQSMYDFKEGYNKSQETHPFSEEDIIEFNEWCNKSYEFDNRCNEWFHGNGYYTTKELLQLWKEQRIKTLYYE